MKKLLIVLLSLLLFASIASAQCGINNPKFGDSKDKTATIFTNSLGVPTTVKKDSIVWEQKTDVGVMMIVVMFHKNKFGGLHILSVMDATKDNAIVATKSFLEMDKLALEEGFVFSKRGNDKQGTTDSMFQEYECKEDKRIKHLITLSKDMTKLVFCVDTLTYFDGELK